MIMSLNMLVGLLLAVLHGFVSILAWCDSRSDLHSKIR